MGAADIKNTEDAKARRESEALATVLCTESAKVIRDPSVRLAVGSCLDGVPENRPSARVLHQAFVAIQDGDIFEILPLPDDPSTSSTLADLAVDFNEGEEAV